MPPRLSVADKATCSGEIGGRLIEAQLISASDAKSAKASLTMAVVYRRARVVAMPPE
jgi:hypothetical protein